MNDLLVFATEECMGWEETREALDELEDDSDFEPGIVQLDPAEHEERFRELGLVVCPSLVYRDEIIAVGPPNADSVKSKVKELQKDETT